MSNASQDGQRSEDTVTPDALQSVTEPTVRGTNVAQAGPSRILGNQAKKQDEVTRQGTQKMRFVPTLPIRRKKPETVVKEEAAPTPKPVERGRGRGRGLGRGRGGGPPPPRPEMQMTASGPFAMGPALAGSSKRRAPRSNFISTMPTGAGSVSLGEGLSRSGAPVLSRERANKGLDKEHDEDLEVYSDPDEGVQIVDMEAIKTMDWMAPESLRRERDEGKNSKKRKKTEMVKKDTKGKATASEDDTVDAVAEGEEVEKNLANALDLSESEEEEEMEDLIDDFAIEDVDSDEDSLTRQEKLYFFQFPQPFPTFTPAVDGESIDVDAMVVDGHKADIEGRQAKVDDKGKKVSFAQDVKPPAPNGAQGDQSKKDRADGTTKDSGIAAKPAEEQRLDGVIGQLEVHRSGIIKMRLGNGMLMDVTAATQPSFLQHAMFLDPVSKRMHVLGEVNRRFVVSPDVDKLLEEMDKQEIAENIKHETQDVPMDTR